MKCNTGTMCKEPFCELCQDEKKKEKNLHYHLADPQQPREKGSAPRHLPASPPPRWITAFVNIQPGSGFPGHKRSALNGDIHKRGCLGRQAGLSGLFPTCGQRASCPVSHTCSPPTPPTPGLGSSYLLILTARGLESLHTGHMTWPDVVLKGTHNASPIKPASCFSPQHVYTK